MVSHADDRRQWLGSVRIRITASSAVVVAVVLIAAAFALIELQRRSLTDNIDTTISLRADDIVTPLKDGTPPENITVSDDAATLIQILDGAGQVLAASPAIAGLPPVTAVIPRSGETVLGSVSNLPIDDETFRVLSRTVETPTGLMTIHVARSLEVVGDSIENLYTLLQVGIPLLTVVVAAGTWYGVGKALSPVEDIRREVAAITDQELSRRVPVSSGDEIGRLGGTMNEMLARLQGAHDRQERFVADASHELRTPLASMRTQIDVALAHPDATAQEATIRSIHDEIMRMQSLIDDLLLLAQSNEDAREIGDSLVDLDDIVFEETQRPRSRPDVTISTGSVSAGQVRGDRKQLARAFRNMLDNATRNARTHVSVGLGQAGGKVTLVVADDGPGIPGDAREHIFERFARLDTGRGREQGGAGLGLAIVRVVAESHGGTVTVDDRYTGGARFVLSLPMA
jgi:signal transduction histidine kinase